MFNMDQIEWNLSNPPTPHNPPQQRNIVPVPRQPRRHLPADRIPHEIQIPDDVENLVAHELVRETQLGVDDLILPHQDEVVETAAGAQAQLVQHLQVLHEAE